MIKISLLLLMSVPLTAGCTQPAGMYRAAQVRLLDSTVCFSVSDDSETRQFAPEIAGLTVSRHTPAGPVTAWKLDLTAAVPAARLSPGDCIAHGFRPKAGPHPTGTESLQPGERYSVDINAFIRGPETPGDGWLNRMYSRDFCLRAAANGTVQLVLVPWGRGEPQWQVCGPEGGSEPTVQGGP